MTSTVRASHPSLSSTRILRISRKDSRPLYNVSFADGFFPIETHKRAFSVSGTSTKNLCEEVLCWQVCFLPDKPHSFNYSVTGLLVSRHCLQQLVPSQLPRQGPPRFKNSLEHFSTVSLAPILRFDENLSLGLYKFPSVDVSDRPDKVYWNDDELAGLFLKFD